VQVTQIALPLFDANVRHGQLAGLREQQVQLVEGDAHALGHLDQADRSGGVNRYKFWRLNLRATQAIDGSIHGGEPIVGGRFRIVQCTVQLGLQIVDLALDQRQLDRTRSAFQVVRLAVQQPQRLQAIRLVVTLVFQSHEQLVERAHSLHELSLECVPQLLPPDIFHGAHLLPANGRNGLGQLSSDEPVVTASFVGFDGKVLGPLVEFLEAMLSRPAGSPDYGPMHVDGAYTIFRLLHPERTTFAAFPTLGRQRSSPSDITPSRMLLDRWGGTRPLASLLRRGYNALRRG